MPDAASFEDTLVFMLSNRSRALRDNLELDPNKPYGVSLAWLSLVFAVFASGAQCADRPAKERELTSQVYSKLRGANYDTILLTAGSLLLLSSSAHGELSDPSLSRDDRSIAYHWQCLVI